jgi:two-component system, chemotaxis family, chemotaxis protein CheY
MARILVIDDDPALRRTVRKILERGGHEVEEAENGLTGLRVVEERPPDLVVTDLVMPEKEGIETILELRERFPEVGVLAVSGAGGVDPTGPLMDAHLFGAHATLPKPFQIQELLDAVAEVLSRGISEG